MMEKEKCNALLQEAEVKLHIMCRGKRTMAAESKGGERRQPFKRGRGMKGRVDESRETGTKTRTKCDDFME